MNILQGLGNLLHTVEHDLVGMIETFQNPATQQKIESTVQELSTILPIAVAVAQDIDLVVKNRTLEGFIALATKYDDHIASAITVDSDFMTDPVAQGQLLERAAIKELQKRMPQANLSLVNAALNLVVPFLHLV